MVLAAASAKTPRPRFPLIKGQGPQPVCFKALGNARFIPSRLTDVSRRITPQGFAVRKTMPADRTPFDREIESLE